MRSNALQSTRGVVPDDRLGGHSSAGELGEERLEVELVLEQHGVVGRDERDASGHAASWNPAKRGSTRRWVGQKDSSGRASAYIFRNFISS